VTRLQHIEANAGSGGGLLKAEDFGRFRNVAAQFSVKEQPAVHAAFLDVEVVDSRCCLRCRRMSILLWLQKGARM
jgi:hypothetical protein